MGLIITIFLLLAKLLGEIHISIIVTLIPLAVELGFHALIILAIGWTHNIKKRGKTK